MGRWNSCTREEVDHWNSILEQENRAHYIFERKSHTCVNNLEILSVEKTTKK